MRHSSQIFLFTSLGSLLLVAVTHFYTTTPSFAHFPSSTLQAAAANTQPLSDDSATSTPEVVPFSTTTYQYKLVQSVDPCTLNTLGQGGWRAVTYGADVDTGSNLILAAGKNETCQNQGVYESLLWAVFEQGTSTTENTLTTEGASALQYKLVQDVDPCTFNTLGKDGWHATQFGTILTITGGRDETCKKAGSYGRVEWVMFNRPLR